MSDKTEYSEKYTELIQTRTDKRLKNELKRDSKLRDRTISYIVRKILEKYYMLK